MTLLGGKEQLQGRAHGHQYASSAPGCSATQQASAVLVSVSCRARGVQSKGTAVQCEGRGEGGGSDGEG